MLDCVIGSNSTQVTLGHVVTCDSVCVCVCERERERERDMYIFFSGYIVFEYHITRIVIM